MVTILKHQSVTTRVSCCATDPTSSVSRRDLSALDWSLSTVEWTLSYLSAGTHQPSSCPGSPRRKVSYKAITSANQIIENQTNKVATNNFIAFKHIVDPNSILVRHKKFLKQLEVQKNAEREDDYVM